MKKLFFTILVLLAFPSFVLAEDPFVYFINGDVDVYMYGGGGYNAIWFWYNLDNFSQSCGSQNDMENTIYADSLNAFKDKNCGGGVYTIKFLITQDTVSGEGCHDSFDVCSSNYNAGIINVYGSFDVGEDTFSNLSFTVVDHSLDSGGGGGISPAEASATLNYNPTIAFLDSYSNKVIHGILPITYEATDQNDTLDKPEYMLGKNPVNLFYAKDGSSKWQLLAKDLSAKGNFSWDTKLLNDGGNYRIKANVLDRGGLLSEMIAENITIDNTAPVFSFKNSPNFSDGDSIQITIESSERLLNQAVIDIIQLGHEPVRLNSESLNLNAKFTGLYRPIKGFDGPAKIYIRGTDLAGNVKETTFDEGVFFVGMSPPPTPKIETPESGLLTGSSTLPFLSGYGLNASKIIVRVNNTKEYVVTKIARDGYFTLENIPLNPKFNRGRNTISVVSVDAIGVRSGPATLDVLVNSPPELTFVEPKSRGLKLNGLINFSWDAFDINNDVLVYKIELSNNGGSSFKTLAEKFSEDHFVWDSTKYSDGSNYVARVTAYDKLSNTSISSHRVTVSNDLPLIILEDSDKVFTSSKSKVVKGVVRSREDLLVKMELSLDNEKTWKILLPEDGAWDSNSEKFNIVMDDLKIGSKSVTLRGISALGHTIINSQGLKVIFDDIAPKFSVDSLPKETMNTRSLSLNGTATDNFSGIRNVEYRIDGSLWYEALLEGQIGLKDIDFIINHKEPISDGTHKIEIRVNDRALNYSEISSQEFSIDATAPRIGSFILDMNGKSLFPDTEKVFDLDSGNGFNLRLAIAGNPVKVELMSGFEAIPIVFDENTNLWKSFFVLDGEGEDELIIIAEDEFGNKKEKVLAKIKAVYPENRVNIYDVGEIKNSFFEKILKLLNI